MNINELPEEILVRILSFLPPSDRLESALTCRRWARTVARAPPLLRDVWFVTDCLRKSKEVETVLANCQRQYENLRFKGALLINFNFAMWTSVGPALRKLELELYCHLPLKVFHFILEACSSLESLKIYKPTGSALFHDLAELSPGMNLEKIQKSMSNLRYLHLGIRMDADTLEHLFILMPNVSSVALWLSQIDAHSLSRLPNILGTSRRVTMLRLHWDLCPYDREPFLGMSSASLRTLVYCGEIPVQLDELRNCPMLRGWLDRPKYLSELEQFDGIREKEGIGSERLLAKFECHTGFANLRHVEIFVTEHWIFVEIHPFFGFICKKEVFYAQHPIICKPTMRYDPDPDIIHIERLRRLEDNTESERDFAFQDETAGLDFLVSMAEIRRYHEFRRDPTLPVHSSLIPFFEHWKEQQDNRRFQF